MRTGVIERQVLMTHVHSGDPGGSTVPIQVDLHWAAAAPWSVRVGFRRDGEQVFWKFGLDVLAAALVRPQAGAAEDGLKVVWTCGRQREAAFLVRVEDPAGGLGWLEARTTDVAEFLADALRAMAIRTATE
ncbi:SsgA family sporulation/cell division regulator [Catenulispora subtropica]|uniref:Sporulation and cell division protein SsgA n=1 Tax=Catenulispora subtropica TaxID=450798 RepID=A0ABP5C2A5_9ACTN